MFDAQHKISFSHPSSKPSDEAIALVDAANAVHPDPAQAWKHLTRTALTTAQPFAFHQEVFNLTYAGAPRATLVQLYRKNTHTILTTSSNCADIVAAPRQVSTSRRRCGRPTRTTCARATLRRP